MNSDGSDNQQLTHSSNNGDPTWSADGSSISFGSDREGSNNLNIYRMASDGTNVSQLTHLDVPYESGDTNWSSDDTKITYEWDINGKKQSDPAAYAEVWIINSDGTNPASTLQPCSGVGCVRDGSQPSELPVAWLNTFPVGRLSTSAYFRKRCGR